MFDRIRDVLKGKADVPVNSPQSRERIQIETPVMLPFVDSTAEAGGDRIRNPDILKGDIDHSGHLRILVRNDEEASRLSIDALAASRDRKTVRYGTDDLAGYLSGQGSLEIVNIAKNGETLATYPIFPVGKPCQARITQITECQNTYEGQLEVYLNEGTITFFDTLYFKNRNSYFAGKDVRLLMSGIAYVLSRVRTQATDMKTGDDDMLVRYENGDVDDYVFRGVVQGVKDVTAFGKKAVILKTAVKTSHDAKPMEIYICATSNALAEKISPGDHVSGIVWIQGFILG